MENTPITNLCRIVTTIRRETITITQNLDTTDMVNRTLQSRNRK